jgi:uncharacterized iron-regulated membrane protein
MPEKRRWIDWHMTLGEVILCIPVLLLLIGGIYGWLKNNWTTEQWHKKVESQLLQVQQELSTHGSALKDIKESNAQLWFVVKTWAENRKIVPVPIGNGNEKPLDNQDAVGVKQPQ